MRVSKEAAVKAERVAKKEGKRGEVSGVDEVGVSLEANIHTQSQAESEGKVLEA